MLIFAAILVIVLIASFAYEYRLKKPDHLVLYEANEQIKLRKSKYYPRHFSLALPNTTYSTHQIVETSAKGNIDIKIKIVFTVAASLKNLQALIRIGGWNNNAVIKAAKEFEVTLEGKVKEYVEKYEVEELSSEKISNYLDEKVKSINQVLGIEVVSLTVQSFEPMDSKISEALKQQESARILEQTELLNQKVRITAAKTKLQADEEIAKMENELALKKFELKQLELEKESLLAQKRTEEELNRKKLQLEYESKELELLKNYPELLMLTPQAARLAEASQSLKNARTIVNLSQNDVNQGIDLISMFQTYLQNNFSKTPSTEEKK